jgi:bile acid-coenzyme A ligase
MSEIPLAERSLGDIPDLHAAVQPDSPALTDPAGTLTWGALAERSHRLAHAMAARGVGHGDYVTIGLPNSSGFMEAAIAAWKLGAVPQPISWRLPKGELEAVLDLVNPKLVVARPELGANRPSATIEDLLSEAPQGVRVESRIAPAWKAPTSGGSTGRPKLIVAGQPGVIASAPAVIWRNAPDDVALMPGPLYHNGPFVSATGALAMGGHLVLMPKFDAEATLAAVQQHRATWLYLVPTMMSRIWGLGEDKRALYEVSSLRTVWHLAAPCPPWLKEAFIGWIGGETLWELYAGTEAQAITIVNGAEWLAKRGTVGRVVVGEMKVVGDDGQDLPPGEIGEIYMRRPDGAPPTYRYVGADAKTLGDWESLGDIGYIDADGYVFLADRRTDMILVGGANIYPAEVEGALEEHPHVHSACVIGLPDDELGNRIHAIIQAEPGLDLAHLDAFLAERLLAYKRPRSFEFSDEPLRDDAGKVRRSALRQERLKTEKNAKGS